MTRPRIIKTTAMSMTLAVLLVVTGTFQASPPVVDGNGHTLRIEVVYDPGNPSVQGLAFVDETPGGGTTTSTIFSTWDPIIDRDPDLALNPYDGQPVVVWSRQEGPDFEIAMLRRMPGVWGPIDILTSNSTSDLAPRAIVDTLERAHIVWYPSGLGGPVYLQGFDVRNGQPTGPPQRPLEPGVTRPLRTTTIGGGDIGGGDDPGLIGGLTSKATQNPCPANPAAAPEHGALMACGRSAAYQLSGCKLVVGVYNPATWYWVQTITDLSRQNMASTSVRAIAQSLANARCGGQ